MSEAMKLKYEQMLKDASAELDLPVTHDKVKLLCHLRATLEQEQIRNIAGQRVDPVLALKLHEAFQAYLPKVEPPQTVKIEIIGGTDAPDDDPGAGTVSGVRECRRCGWKPSPRDMVGRCIRCDWMQGDDTSQEALERAIVKRDSLPPPVAKSAFHRIHAPPSDLERSRQAVDHALGRDKVAPIKKVEPPKPDYYPAQNITKDCPGWVKGTGSLARDPNVGAFMGDARPFEPARDTSYIPPPVGINEVKR